ncbi:unnamed protein product [Rhizophagus irregularis]|jgi:hypothetical protein|uniref:Uncharacterized protein n=1 Tax=Rhizophagus irregularis TaxID=588596 RepID=A0A915Z671_9GLOM|nr:unnamed protein product [Rhizophagus irregularis]
MLTFSELTPSLTVTEFKINVEGLDYTVLGHKLEPTKDVIAINSNFIHKAFEGYEQYLSKPKGERRCRRSTPDNPLNRRRRTGDGSTFNACIEFVIILADTVHTIRYFPKSGSIQVFGSFDPVAIFLRYLSECSLPEFSSVELVGGNKALLRNYKFVINIGGDKFINLSTLAYALESIDGIREILPFPIKYIKNDAGDIHSKIAIIFTSKIRVHIWPKSGKVNIFGTKTELDADMVYKFLQKLFSNPYDFGDFICDAPIPDCER